MRLKLYIMMYHLMKMRIVLNKESIENKEPSIDEDNILSETKEQDLFNLIDDMYSSDDEDEEDDE